MNEGYAEGHLDFSSMTDGELLEIVNSSSGRYQQEFVDGAKQELAKRRGHYVGAEGQRIRDEGGAQPPVLLENVSGRQLFSTGQIAVASFLGAPLSGSLLVAQNFRALGKVRSAWQPLLIGVAATILLSIFALLLPEKFPNYILPAGSCLGMYFYARQQQGDVVDNHLRAGGKKGSWLVLISVSIGCTIIILILLIAVVIAFDIQLPGEETDQPARVEALQSYANCAG
ncbi:MAG TPA: hypothetical protein VFI24_03010 [Pyrinomonadaceae bacterium]|nr:hypothetical protein [Pyrinomonadaceae bacterium]